MTTLTIIPDDLMVVVDGEGIVVNSMNISPDIHAVHWDSESNKGHIEFKSGIDNEELNVESANQYLTMVDSFNLAKTENIAERQKEVDYINKISPQRDESTYNTKRMRAFYNELPLGDQLDSILKFIDSQPTKSIEMQSVIDKSNDIKNRFPKENV